MHRLLLYFALTALAGCVPPADGTDDEAFRDTPSGAGGQAMADPGNDRDAPGPGTDVSSQSMVVKADGEPIGYAQLVSEHVISIFDPNRKILFGINDTTGHVTGWVQSTPNADLSEVMYYQGAACRGGAIAYNDLANADDMALAAGPQCEDDFYRTRDRRSLTAIGGDGYGRTAGTAISYAKSIEWQIASIRYNADTCTPANPAMPACVVERRVTEIIPVTFPLPITLHAGETIEEDPDIQIGGQ